jgi:hypothetical protein
VKLVADIDPVAPAGKQLKKFVVLGVPYEVRGDATERVGAGTSYVRGMPTT